MSKLERLELIRNTLKDEECAKFEGHLGIIWVEGNDWDCVRICNNLAKVGINTPYGFNYQQSFGKYTITVE